MPDDQRTTPDYRPAPFGRRCTATTRSGAPCRAPVVVELSIFDENAEIDPARTGATGQNGAVRSFCQAHRPDIPDSKRREASAKGGRNRSNIARLVRAAPSDSQTLLSTLYAAVAETREGSLPASNARAIAALAGAVVQVLESVELQQKLAELEANIAPAPRPWSPPSRREVA